MQNKHTLIDFLNEHQIKDPVWFHMPGHKGSGLYRRFGYDRFLDSFMDIDVTEIPGADNLFHAEGIIREVQERYADLYGAKRSWMVINGTSGSLIASILACVPRGGKMIMARNCHKSVFNGLRIAEGVPVYAHPEIIEEYGISGEVTPAEIKRLVDADPDAYAVVITSPNYYGICSDIGEIAKIAHDAGMPLIVDQAHGAHLKFFHKYGCGEGLKQAAEDMGADIVTNSTHKTLASMTQSAVLNLCSDMVDPADIEEQLQVVESSSPSYILMSSLDINARLIEEHGAQLFREWKENIDHFYEEASWIPGLGLLKDPGMDVTKIDLDFGIHGLDLEQRLNERGIFPELATGNILMCMSGIGNVRQDYDALLDALKEIGEGLRREIKSNAEIKKKAHMKQPAPGRLTKVPERRRAVELSEAPGHVCAVSIIPYPPGTPLVCPGEEITCEIVDYVRTLIDDGEKVMGVDMQGRVVVGAD